MTTCGPTPHGGPQHDHATATAAAPGACIWDVQPHTAANTRNVQHLSSPPVHRYSLKNVYKRTRNQWATPPELTRNVQTLTSNFKLSYKLGKLICLSLKYFFFFLFHFVTQHYCAIDSGEGRDWCELRSYCRYSLEQSGFQYYYVLLTIDMLVLIETCCSPIRG